MFRENDQEEGGAANPAEDKCVGISRGEDQVAEVNTQINREKD